MHGGIGGLGLGGNHLIGALAGNQLLGALAGGLGGNHIGLGGPQFISGLGGPQLVSGFGGNQIIGGHPHIVSGLGGNQIIAGHGPEILVQSPQGQQIHHQYHHHNANTQKPNEIHEFIHHGSSSTAHKHPPNFKVSGFYMNLFTEYFIKSNKSNLSHREARSIITLNLKKPKNHTSIMNQAESSKPLNMEASQAVTCHKSMDTITPTITPTITRTIIRTIIRTITPTIILTITQTIKRHQLDQS